MLLKVYMLKRGIQRWDVEVATTVQVEVLDGRSKSPKDIGGRRLIRYSSQGDLIGTKLT